MHFTPKPTDQSALCAPALATLRAWVIGLLAWFCDLLDTLPPALTRAAPVRAFVSARKAGIARDLRASVRHLGHALIILGTARMDFALRRRVQRSYPGAKRSRCSERHLTSALAGMNAGTLRQRAHRLAAALADLEPLIARTLKLMRAIWRDVRLPAPGVTASCDLFTLLFPQTAPQAADSS